MSFDEPWWLWVANRSSMRSTAGMEAHRYLSYRGRRGGGGGIRGTIRWMAPELLTYDPEMKSNLHTKASDVWAFGMTVYVSIFSSFCIIFLSLTPCDSHPSYYLCTDVITLGTCHKKSTFRAYSS